jgi:enamine deaminase RidA (YjgF/YER057c/UK114 family)
MPVDYINPDKLHKNPAFTNVVVVTGPVKTIYIGGQNAVDVSGTIIGRGDIEAQAEQVFKNLRTALQAGGADLEHVVKWNIYTLQDQPAQPAFGVFQKVWGDRPHPPAITVVKVAALAHPDFLMEMDAIAVVPL